MVDINSALIALSLSLGLLEKAIPEPVMGGDKIERNHMFDAIMGCSEAEFKEILGVTGGPNMTSARGVINSRPAKFTKLRGSEFLLPNCWDNFGAPRVGKLFDTMVKFKGLPGTGRLFIMLKSDYKKKADIRWLQEQFPGAVFQIASTFACLEGGAIEFDSELNEMSASPVQGEDAVLATITGAVIRKYLLTLHSRDLLYSSDPAKGVRKFFVFQSDRPSSRNYFRVKDLNSKIKLDLGFLENNVRVGIHRDVFVTSGPLDPEILMSRVTSKGKTIWFPQFDRRLGVPQHTVHQIFVAALDLNRTHKPKVNVDSLAASGASVPKAILRGMYKGTIAAAWDVLKGTASFGNRANSFGEFMEPSNPMPRLFLTIVGAGAFDNKSEWVVDILIGLKDAIRKSGLQICLVVWDDNGTPAWVNKLEQAFGT